MTPTRNTLRVGVINLNENTSLVNFVCKTQLKDNGQNYDEALYFVNG